MRLLKRTPLVSLLMVLVGALAAPPMSAAVTISVGRTRPDGTSQLDVGVTQTQYSLDLSGDAPAVANGKALLSASTHLQNQHIMGWGAGNPEPSPGVYDWTSLDTRINLIRATGAMPVITLCCAPDWMKGGTAGTTDWSLRIRSALGVI